MARQMTKKSISQLLEDYVYTHQYPHITISDLVNSLGDRGHGVLLLLLALPNVLLLTSIPGTSTFFGIPICLVGIQLILKYETPWIPKKVQTYQIERETVLLVLRKSIPYILKIEQFIRPRLTYLTQNLAEQIIGVFVLVLGVIIALPIPFGNFLGGLGLVFISLALIEKDGIFALIGTTLTLGISFAIFKIIGKIFVFVQSFL